MIKASLNGGDCRIEAEGGVAAVSNEVLMMVSALYGNYCRGGYRAAAELFRAAVTVGLTRPESPVWQEDLGTGVSMCIPRDAVRGKEGADAES